MLNQEQAGAWRDVEQEGSQALGQSTLLGKGSPPGAMNMIAHLHTRMLREKSAARLETTYLFELRGCRTQLRVDHHPQHQQRLSVHKGAVAAGCLKTYTLTSKMLRPVLRAR